MCLKMRLLFAWLWHASAAPQGDVKLDYDQGASPLSFAPRLLGLPCCSQQMPPSWDPRHKELAVSQVLLILIGSG